MSPFAQGAAAEATQADMDDTLGGRIVSAREAAGLTTAQLARRLGVKSATLQNWETDRSEPRSNKLFMLAGLLNVSPTWLINGLGAAPSDEIAANGDQAALREQLIDMRNQLERLGDSIDRALAQIDAG
ncbi:helix-turn-helix domain-containing protein [Roseitalea porphyridii]|uniref:Helix-turn-helix domain-containing protein n=2 Tax=Roseitalea porphyridii TaxID=1852022 RepID=A0A4P6V629_9HYPH|nr:helix-turn-helix domain-containing protein [Roseitalea porphyridii]QBK32254.1 helix-turn-helix domain-containing protein [Roseitalea porphyridii]